MLLCEHAGEGDRDAPKERKRLLDARRRDDASEDYGHGCEATVRILTGLAHSSALLDPEGLVLAEDVAQSGNVSFYGAALERPGTYTVLFRQFQSAPGTGQIIVQLYRADDVRRTSTLSATGDTHALTIAAPGQDARYDFVGAAGDRFSVARRNNAIPSAIIVTAYGPFGDVLGQTSDDLLGAIEVTQDGGHAFTLDPSVGGIGTIDVELWKVPANDSGQTVSIGGQPVTIGIAAPGHRPEVRLPNSAGSVSVTVTTSWNANDFLPVGAPGSLCFDVDVLAGAPPGAEPPLTPPVSADCSSPNVVTATLPGAGTHTIRIATTGTRYGGTLTVGVTTP